MAQDASRAKAELGRQIDVAPCFTPDQVITELLNILSTCDVDVRYAFEPLCEEAYLETASIAAMKARINDPSVEVKVTIGTNNAGVRLMTFHLSRPR